MRQKRHSVVRQDCLPLKKKTLIQDIESFGSRLRCFIITALIARITVRSNCNAVKWFLSLSDSTRGLASGRPWLSKSKSHVIQRAGIKNQGAGAISRLHPGGTDTTNLD